MTSTALQRIKEITVKEYFKLQPCYEDLHFLLKAFKVMREIAAEGQDEYAMQEEVKKTRDEKFEERMSK